MVRAIKAVQKMTPEQKIALVDEIFAPQPNLLGSVLVLRNLGVSPAKQEFALEMLLLGSQAMKESGMTWPLITEDEQENQLHRHNSMLRFYASLENRAEKNNSLHQFVDAHPEKELLAWVMGQTRDLGMNSSVEESDKYLLQVVVNLVNCIAFVPFPANQAARVQ